MNKRQKQALQSQLTAEQKTLRKLKKSYETALNDIDDKIAALMARTDVENMQSIIYQKKYQEALRTNISDILDAMNYEEYKTISNYLEECYEGSFFSTVYDLHGQGIPIIIPMDQTQVVRALTNDSKLSKPLYQSLGESTVKLKNNIQRNLSRGIAQGSSYADITRMIAREMVGDYSRFNGGAFYFASRIARTEGHRIQNQAALDVQQKAKENGADIVKQWDATLDGRTRPDHARADGQLRELDELFDVGGEKMEAPGVGGSAKQVCNCRCALLQRARWALDEDELKTLQERAEFYGLDKTDDFDTFKSKYMKAVKEEEKSPFGTVKDIEKLKQSGMSEADYNEYMRTLREHNNPDIQRLYNQCANDINGVTLTANDGYYQPSTNRLVFDYPNQRYIDNGQSKYSTLAHEYGHYFDAKANFGDLHFKEVDAIRDNVYFAEHKIKRGASMSDEFLEAVRKDKKYLQSVGFENLKFSMKGQDASAGVQDAIDGMFVGSEYRIGWGHGEKYYNRQYKFFKDMKKYSGGRNPTKELQDVYKSLGFDARNQGKVASICRDYETSSEMWANIMSAEVNGGQELEYVKTYLPNSYQAMLDILKGVK